MILRQIAINREKQPDAWYFEIPAIAQLATEPLRLTAGVTVIVGENGSGKSTFLEALASSWHWKLPAAVKHWGARPSGEDTDLHWTFTLDAEHPRPSGGCFLRAEAMHQLFTAVDAADDDPDSLAQLEAAGDPDFDFDATWRAVRNDDVLTLIYTSGTTGAPKGVEITHANVLAQIATALDGYGLRRGDRTTSYLPSAHIADRMACHYVQMIHGTQVTAVPDLRQIVDALPDARPTYWFAVPRVWDKMKVALESAFAESHGFEQQLLRRSLELSRKHVHARAAGRQLGTVDRALLAVLDRAVLSKVRAKLGLDHLRCAFSGAASISPETLEFFMALGIKVSEVWGMSETSGVAMGNPLDRVKVGTVGTVLPGVEMRLADDGEVLVRSAIVMRGYRNDPVRTAEVLDADGWLHTGDVATIDADGYVTIVDRKKELIINAAGKNMSPSNIEDTLKSACPLIGQAVAIGNGQPYNTAMIVLDNDAAAAFAQKLGIDGTAAVLAGHQDLVATIASGIAAGNAKLSRVEQIKRFRILAEFWEPGGPQITPTLKLRRKPIAVAYATEIEALYAATLAPGVHEPSQLQRSTQ